MIINQRQAAIIPYKICSESQQFLRFSILPNPFEKFTQFEKVLRMFLKFKDFFIVYVKA